MRLRDSALEYVTGQAGIMELQVLAMMLVLGSRGLGLDVRRRRTRLGRPNPIAGLNLPRDVGEVVVLVNDGHGARRGSAYKSQACTVDSRTIGSNGMVRLVTSS